MSSRVGLCVLFVLIPLLGFSQCWPRSQKLVPSKAMNTSEALGSSIDYEANIAVVAAPQSDTLRTSSGVVYVFEFKNDVWQKVASLTASDHREYQNFGRQVVIHNDRIFVADPARANGGLSVGAIYIYEKPSEGWHDMVETSILLPAYPRPYQFGVSMDVYENSLLVGASYTFNENNVGTGVAFLFELQGGNWKQIATLKSPHAYPSSFGSNVELGKDVAVVVADEEQRPAYTARGAVYVFEKNSVNGWIDAYPNARLTESSGNESIAYLGAGLALDEARNTIFVTEVSWDETRGYNTIQAYKRPGTQWSDMTETETYLATTDSRVDQTLRFEEPYLYSSGSLEVEVFTHNSEEWILSNPIARLTISGLSPQQQFGEGICVRNGHVLVSAPAGLTLDRDALLTPANPRIYEFILPATGWIPENIPDHSFTYLPLTATDYVFGINVDIDGDIAIVGSPYDNVNRSGAGAVYVYRLANYQWTKIATLTPSDGERFDNFGRSIAISDDYVAVGVPNKHLRDETGKIIDHNLGAVYIFKKPPAGWTDMNETYKLVQSQGKLDYTSDDEDDDDFGITVDLDYPYLIASRFERGSRPNSGSVLVFNLSGNAAVHEATLNPSSRDAVNNFGHALSISDSVIAVGCGTNRFWMIESNVVFVYERKGERWKDATESTLLFPSDNGSTGYLPGVGFGESIDITEDGSHIIVGSPAWFDGIIFETTEYFKGAAYIFQRPPDGWKGLITEKARLTIPDQKSYACMGVSVHIEDRYAVVGSPQNYFFTGAGQNPGTGKAYFYQKPDDGWKYKLPDKIIQGDESGSPQSDYFGASVEGVFGYLMIGAFADDNQSSVDAGSVYVYTEYPFINPTQSPVCENAAPIQLTAVPSGGSWLGNGMANPRDGIFYASLAGPGEHKIRYSVDDCTSANTLLIKVKEVPKPGLMMNKDSLFYCGKTTIPLKVELKKGFTYSWSYSEDGNAFVPVGPRLPRIDADKRGYYKVLVSNDCASLADSIWVGDLFPDAGPDFASCVSDAASQLVGNYSAGSWAGPGVSSSGQFDPSKAGIGLHQLRYNVSPSEGCLYSDALQARVSSLPDINIQSDGVDSFCYTGRATLSVSGVPTLDYAWYFGKESGEMSITDEIDPVFVAREPGLYKVVVSDGQCSTEANINLFPPPFQPTVTPDLDSASFCANQPFDIAAQTIPGADYVWFRYVDGIPQSTTESVGSFSIQVEESGKYKLTIQSHGCVFDSDEMILTTIPADSVYVPNVITPNGDRWNENFEIYVEGIDEYSLKIFGRYGREVWSGRKDTAPWNAADVSSGVYFWVLSYRSQCSEGNDRKGWVQVLKE
jgi:hypothetical protein